MYFKRYLQRLHFLALSIIIINTILKLSLGIGLLPSIVFAIKLLILLTGVLLCFYYIRPTKKRVVYFGFYPIVLFFLLIGFIFKGIFGAVLMSMILYPILPYEKVFETKNVAVSIPFQGFVGRCCEYQVAEKIGYVFQEEYKRIDAGGRIDVNTFEVKSTGDELVLSFRLIGDSTLIQKHIVK